MPLAGLLAPKLRVARLIQLAALVFVATLLLPPLAWSCPAWSRRSSLWELGKGSLDVAMNAYASGVEQRWKAPILSSFNAAWNTGGLTGALGAARAGSSRAMVSNLAVGFKTSFSHGSASKSRWRVAYVAAWLRRRPAA